MAVAKPKLNNYHRLVAFYLFGLFVATLVGLRYEIGVDWFNYLVHLDAAKDTGFQITLDGKDPGYATLNWLAAEFDFGIWFVNLISSIIFVVCLFKFVARLTNPWLVLVVCIPYLIIVFSMNYTRQSVAFAFLLMGLISLEKNKIRSFAFYIVIAALFHKSTLIMLAISFFMKNRNRLSSFVALSLIGILGFFAILAETYDSLVNQYIVEEMSSSGAMYRVILCAFPAALFIMMRGRFEVADARKRIILIFSCASIVFVPLVIFTPYSTAIDRLALYFIPIQLYIYSYLPELFRTAVGKNISILLISLLYFSMMFFWLLYSDYASHWLPYHFYPFAN